MGPKINISRQEVRGKVTSDGKYLFFNRINNGELYWVSTQNIDNLKNINFPPYLKSKIPDQKVTIGQLYSYTVPDSTFFDDDGNNTLTYTSNLSNGNPLPLWLSFDSITQTFSETPDEASTLNIKLIAADTANAGASAQFILSIDDNLSSINQIGAKNLVICPNPTTGLVNIFLSENQHLKIYVEVYNTEGKMILKDTAQDTAKAVINLTGYTKGMYIFRVIADGDIFNERVCLK